MTIVMDIAVIVVGFGECEHSLMSLRHEENFLVEFEAKFFTSLKPEEL